MWHNTTTSEVTLNIKMSLKIFLAEIYVDWAGCAFITSDLLS